MNNPPITHNRPHIHPQQRLDYENAEHLATLTCNLRPDWNTRSTITLLEPLVPHIPALDIAAALIALARNPQAQTPKLLHHPGPHWNHLNNPDSPTRPNPCPIEHHARAGKLANNCPECRLLRDFPPTISSGIYHQLDPVVQRLIDQSPTTTIIED